MMRAARMLTTVAATALVALVSGHIVQNGDITAAKIGASLQSPGMARASVMPDIPKLPRPPIVTLQATPLPTTRGSADQQPESLTLQALDRSRFGADASASCAAEMKATPSGNGMIRISLYAPCNGSEPVTLRHAGLGFTEVNTSTGRLTVEIPALTAAANVEAILQSGERISTQVNVPDAGAYRRVRAGLARRNRASYPCSGIRRGPWHRWPRLGRSAGAPGSGRQCARWIHDGSGQP